MENYIEYGYVGLAVISFLAATILPVGSEVFFMAMIAAGYPAGWCLWWASLGNTLGGMTNYYLGRLGKTEWLEKHLKFSAAKMAGVQEQLRYKGALSAFFSFLPVYKTELGCLRRIADNEGVIGICLIERTV